MYEKYYRWIGLPKEKTYYSMKQQKKNDLLLLAIKLIKKNTWS